MSRKRKFQETKKQHRKEMSQQSEVPEIITRVQAQRGVRGQLVLFENCSDIQSILQNAVNQIRGSMVIRNINELAGKYELLINDEVMAEGSFDTAAIARKSLAESAVLNLKKSCFTIVRKIHPRDSPEIQLELPSQHSSNNESSDKTASSAAVVGGIGAKLMLQMGWSGGGLGVNEQGTTNIIQPFLQIQRQGLGRNDKNIVPQIKMVLQDYASSGDINSIAFSSDFTKEERIVIHEVARKLNLKSRSYDKGQERVLVVQSKVLSWDLVKSLLEAGGENEQFQLLIPTDFTV